MRQRLCNKSNKLYEYTSYDELDAEGRGKSRLLPLRLAIDKLRGKERSIKINLKEPRDYHIFYQQLVKAGSRISIPAPSGEEIGPRKFAQCFELLGIEDSTDLEDMIKNDSFYRRFFEENGIKFSFDKETRLTTGGQDGFYNATKVLSSLGITPATEGNTWEWGLCDDSDFEKTAPEGRQIWVIRSHYYNDGFPCMFLYPAEGVYISDYSTELDKFYMHLATDAGYMKDYVDTKKFNPLWVACPCYYDWFCKHPVPVPNETVEQVEKAEAMRKAEESDYTTYDADELGESVVADRKKLKRLVESYGKKDVLNFVRHLNESAEDFVKIYMSVPVDDWIDDINYNYNESLGMYDVNGFIQFLKDNFEIIASEAFDEVGYHEPGADSMSFLIPVNRKSVEFFVQGFGGANEFKEGIEAYITDDDYYEGPVGILEPTDKNELRKLLRVL